MASVSVAAALLVGCSRDNTPSTEVAASGGLATERLKLPGFSMDAPKGELVFTSKSASVGKHQISLPRVSLVAHLLDDQVRNGQFIVSWKSLVESREEWERDTLPMYLQSLKPTIPDARLLHREALDTEHWFVVIGSERLPMVTGFVSCDPGFQVEFTVTRFHDVQRQAELARSLLRSVRCEVTDANHKRLLAATRLPDGFGEIPIEAGQQFQSLDGETLLINFTSGELAADRAIYRSVLHSLISNIFDNKTPESALVDLKPPTPGPGRKVNLSRALLPTSGETVYIGSKYCEQEGASLMFLWSASKFSDALAWERFSQVDCPGGDSVPSPSFESIKPKN